jgi:hypothetical protein
MQYNEFYSSEQEKRTVVRKMKNYLFFLLTTKSRQN